MSRITEASCEENPGQNCTQEGRQHGTLPASNAPNFLVQGESSSMERGQSYPLVPGERPLQVQVSDRTSPTDSIKEEDIGGEDSNVDTLTIFSGSALAENSSGIGTISEVVSLSSSSSSHITGQGGPAVGEQSDFAAGSVQQDRQAGNASLSPKRNRTKKSLIQLSAEAFFRCGNQKGACPFWTESAAEFDVHLKRVHAEEGLFVCVHCGSEEMGSDSLLQHLEGHLRLQRQPLYCTESTCEFNSLWPEEVLGHIASHPTASSFTCWLCSSAFSTAHEFSAHVKQNLIHVACCPHCPAKDTDRGRILAHISGSHPGKGRTMRIHSSLLCQERTLSDWHAKNMVSRPPATASDKAVIVISDDEDNTELTDGQNITMAVLKPECKTEARGSGSTDDQRYPERASGATEISSAESAFNGAPTFEVNPSVTCNSLSSGEHADTTIEHEEREEEEEEEEEEEGTRANISNRPFPCPPCTARSSRSSSREATEKQTRKRAPRLAHRGKGNRAAEERGTTESAAAEGHQPSQRCAVQTSVAGIKRKYRRPVASSMFPAFPRARTEAIRHQTTTSLDTDNLRVRDIFHCIELEGKIFQYSCKYCKYAFETRKEDKNQGYTRIWMHARNKHKPGPGQKARKAKTSRMAGLGFSSFQSRQRRAALALRKQNRQRGKGKRKSDSSSRRIERDADLASGSTNTDDHPRLRTKDGLRIIRPGKYECRICGIYSVDARREGITNRLAYNRIWMHVNIKHNPK